MRYNVLSKYHTELMGAAILWVMLFHATDLGRDLLPLKLFRAAGFGGVDIFILLSSMGLVMSLARRKQDHSAFMARRASRILPAYYLVMVPYTLFQILAHRAAWSALLWNCTLLYYWVHPSGAFNWYVAGAMTFYAVTPACFRLLRRSKHRELLTAAGVLAGLAVSQLLMQDRYWEMVDIFYRIPIFFLGLLMGFYLLEDRALGRKDILFWCLSLLAGALYLFAVFTDRPHVLFYPQCHLFLFITVPMCLMACWCFERLPLGWLQKFLGLLGAHSLEIYLLNVSLFAEVELLRQSALFGVSDWIYYPLSFAVNILLGLLLHRLVESLRRLWTKNRETA